MEDSAKWLAIRFEPGGAGNGRGSTPQSSANLLDCQQPGLRQARWDHGLNTVKGQIFGLVAKRRRMTKALDF